MVCPTFKTRNDGHPGGGGWGRHVPRVGTSQGRFAPARLPGTGGHSAEIPVPVDPPQPAEAAATALIG